MDWGTAETAQLAGILFQRALHMLGPIVRGLFLVALTVGALQSGVQVSFQPLAPNWDRISPVKGWSRLMSSRGVMRGVSSILKAVAVAVVAICIFRNRLAEIAFSSHGTLPEAIGRGWHLTLLLALAVAGAIILIGLLDYIYQRWRHEQDLRMTRQEFLDEHKEEEGDPMIRARIKKLQREMRERRSIQDVPKASVVITNPTHFAVAVQYDRETMAAPKVIAKGSDAIARRIVEKAREHDIHVVENKPLARALFAAVDVGREIPIELYYAVAEILAYVNRLKRSA